MTHSQFLIITVTVHLHQQSWEMGLLQSVYFQLHKKLNSFLRDMTQIRILGLLSMSSKMHSFLVTHIIVRCSIADHQIIVIHFIVEMIVSIRTLKLSSEICGALFLKLRQLLRQFDNVCSVYHILTRTKHSTVWT